MNREKILSFILFFYLFKKQKQNHTKTKYQQ